MEITSDLQIPDGEISFTASRSGGPGGQNVNKVNSKVTLLFDVLGSPSLSEEQKARIVAKLRNRINGDGILSVTSQSERSQLTNREAATRRFITLVRNALVVERPRKKTRVSKAAKARRLDQKSRHSRKKRTRRDLGG